MKRTTFYRYRFFLTLAAIWLLTLEGMAQGAYNRTITNRFLRHTLNR